MKDDFSIEQLRDALANVELPARDVLDGFDLGLVGLDCRREQEDGVWTCPFQPGCGAKSPSDCPVIKERAQVLSAPKRAQ